MNSRPLISLDEAIKASRAEAREWFSSINPSLVNLLSLIDYDRRYVRAEGPFLWDEDGNRYIDMLGAYGALNLGHNHPRILEALRKIEGLPGVMPASLNPIAGALARNLADIAPGDLEISFFGNSGAEAVEAALKLARAATGRKRLVYAENSFHGKTYGALSVTGRKKYRAPFEPLVPDCVSVPYADPEALERALAGASPSSAASAGPGSSRNSGAATTPGDPAEEAAAFIVEPVQGEGGVIVPPAGYLKEAERLCHKYGALLIVDEVQTGLGRTGKMFACEHDGVEPDIMALAKSLGGGAIPMGACITKRSIWETAYGGLNKFLLQTSTFMNNTPACAAGIATLETLLGDGLVAAAEEKGTYFLERLRAMAAQHPMIHEVRGLGLMIGVEFYEPAEGWLDTVTGGVLNNLSRDYLGTLIAGELLNEHRVATAYTLNNPNVIRLQPPLVVEKEQLDEVVAALDAVCSKRKGFWGLALSTGKTALKGLLKQ